MQICYYIKDKNDEGMVQIMKDTIIFDLDGTLLNTLDDLARSTNYALSQYNYPTRTTDQVRSFVGNGIRLLIERALPDKVSDDEFEKVFATFKEHYMIHCNDQTGAYEGIPELLKKLKGHHIKMAIVSNKADAATKELHELYFKGLIDVAIGENEAAGIRKKPSADMVIEALRELGSTSSEAIYVGDSDVDIDTAANANMDCISCSWGFRSIEFLKEHGATHIINKPDELLNFIDC